MTKRIVMLGGIAVGAFGLFAASPARASVSGDCTGSAVVTPSAGGAAVTIDPAVSSGPFTVPLSGSAAYRGAINGVPAGSQPYSGKVVLRMPPGLPDIVVADWSGTSAKTQASGTYDYDLPSFVPRGVEVPLRAEHTQGGRSCSADVTVKVDGSVVGAYSIATGALALGAGAGFAGLASKPFVRARRRAV